MYQGEIVQIPPTYINSPEKNNNGEFGNGSCAGSFINVINLLRDLCNR